MRFEFDLDYAKRLTLWINGAGVLPAPQTVNELYLLAAVAINAAESKLLDDRGGFGDRNFELCEAIADNSARVSHTLMNFLQAFVGGAESAINGTQRVPTPETISVAIHTDDEHPLQLAGTEPDDQTEAWLHKLIDADG